ncbi:DUF7221 family queuine tRNA-ribosyltransferase-like protein [Nocardia noduli]|uniref:deazapurine DNA modification protein DpdA family protein n=1 Tax=Nocardia noduli TaxID=2815722 RepID=UPI001C23CBCD|nr:hypothetical protein [Nocardia noduli]
MSRHDNTIGLAPAGGHGFERFDTAWGPLTQWTGTSEHPDPARRMRFFLGLAQPSLLDTAPVPVFLSATRLVRYRTRGERFPVRMNLAPYAGDSGAYSALVLTRDRHSHPWWASPDEYGALWARLIEDIGPPCFVGIQDYPCEPACLTATGLSIDEHQRLTVENYLYLVEQFDFVPWLPTLQGWRPEDFVAHVGMYERAGVDLTGRWVGVGSICRRNADHDIARILTALAPFGMRLHGYGVSLRTLALAGHLLHSADSQGWSMAARRARTLMPGCVHLSRPDATGRRHLTDCRHCLRYALAWREKAMHALRVNHMQRATADPGLWDDPLPAGLAATPSHQRSPGRAHRTRGDQAGFALFDLTDTVQSPAA